MPKDTSTIFFNMINMIFNNDHCCQNCPNRKVGCHNINTCSAWAKHEANKEKIYKERLKKSTMIAIERKHIALAYKRMTHDRKHV